MHSIAVLDSGYIVTQKERENCDLVGKFRN